MVVRVAKLRSQIHALPRARIGALSPALARKILKTFSLVRQM